MITGPPMRLTNHAPTVQVVQPRWSGASGALACTLSHGAIQGGHPRLRSVGARGSQPSSRHPLLWWGMNSTVFGKYPLDQRPEPHGASSRALNACESTCVNPTGYNGPTRSASSPTEVNNALTWFESKTCPRPVCQREALSIRAAYPLACLSGRV